MPYDARHRRIRKSLAPKAIGTLCSVCGRPMTSADELDAAHDVPLVVDRSGVASEMQHATCNRSEGGRLGNERRNLRPSRVW